MLSCVIFDISGLAKPSNRPLRELEFVETLAMVSMMSIALGPPITYIGTSGIAYLIILTIFHPGSEIHGIPASLTIAICLLYSILLIISNIFVYE